jgi:hypothetical protein
MNTRGRPDSGPWREKWQDRAVVGVTGHRLLSDEDRVADGIDLALRQAELASGARPLTLLSPLASGADQLVARRALLRPGIELVVPLPMPLAEYLDDFPVGASRDAFLELLSQATETVNMPPTTVRDEAYQAVGRFVVEHSDLLIAVWDGKAARGQGGTGQTVAEARRRGLPLAWILAENRAGRSGPSLSRWSEEGTVRFERFPPRSQDR